MRDKVLGWLALGATAALLVLLKRHHLGVTHYNWFLIILLAWTLGLIGWLRWLKRRARGEEA